jgi:hypothetical protein
MGNKTTTPESWVEEILKDKTEPIWGKDNLQKIDYPKFWNPHPRNYPNQDINTLQFGNVYQFPPCFISPVATLAFTDSFPKISLRDLAPPPPRVLHFLSQMEHLEMFNKESQEKKDIYYMARPWFEMIKEYGNDVKDYLESNMYRQLNFFGLVDAKDDAAYFLKKLNYIPSNFEAGVIYFLLGYLALFFNNDNAPFLAWKDFTVYSSSTKIPGLVQFNQSVSVDRMSRNFWIVGRGLENPESVLRFWRENRELVKVIIEMKGALNKGSVGNGNDTFTDQWGVREKFLDIYKYHKDGGHLFQFHYFNMAGLSKFEYLEDVNAIIRNYLWLMVADIEKLIPDIWNRPEGSYYQSIPLTPINPIDPASYMGRWEAYRDYWKETSAWFLFNSNRPPWPLRFQPLTPEEEEKWGEIQVGIRHYLETYPLRALKVPPFSFGEFTRRTQEWHRLADKQWDDYFLWVVKNVLASNAPNWVQPGQQMKNVNGELMYFEEKGVKYPLINSYPDYGIMVDDGPGVGRGIRFLIPVTIPFDWFFGDSFWDFINGSVAAVFKLIIQVLETLYEVAVSVLPLLWPILLGVGAFFYFTKSDNVINLPPQKPPTL